MKSVKRIAPVLIVVWIALISISLILNLNSISNSIFQNAKMQSSAFFDQIEIMRAWNAKHGGVYVKVGDDVYPNPYLKVPNRDLTVDSLGIELTLINPAFMTRLVAYTAAQQNKTKFHITSLNPIRPQNKADHWETKMLQSFEEGTLDTMELKRQNGQMVYKYMRPLIVKPACMKCHSIQGYELGDIRGGIQVTIPADDYIKNEASLRYNAWAIHLIVLLLGLIGMFAYIRLINSYFRKLLNANKETEKQKVIAQKAYDKAELASHYKSLFLANMSHEIRTPLNGIIGFTRILKESKLSKTQEEQLDIINFSSENLLSIINDIIDYSKIESNQLILENITINIKQVINETHKMLLMKANEKGLDFSLSIHPDIPTWIVGDQTRIKQILINFTNNAVKFTEKGFVNIHVSPIETKGSKMKIKFEIIDTGIGVSEENHDKLFKVFSQAEASTSRKYGGSGLGLAISKQLATMMDGEVGFTSEAGKGSVFWFTGEYELSKAPVKTNLIEKVDLSKVDMKILLVEDNIINQKVATAIFSNIGKKITIANNGKEAVDIFAKEKFDLVFMDIQMPVMDGYEAAEEIRKCEGENMQLERCRIIAMTANALKGEKEKCLSFGMTDYLAKPFRLEDLYEIIIRNL